MPSSLYVYVFLFPQNALKKLAKGGGKKKEKKLWSQPAASSEKMKKPKKVEVGHESWICVSHLVGVEKVMKKT